MALEMVRVTGKDGARIEINPQAVARLQRPSLEDKSVEITLIGGEKFLVRQTLDQLLKIFGCKRRERGEPQEQTEEE